MRLSINARKNRVFDERISIMKLELPQIEELLENIACDLCGDTNEEFLYTKPGTISGYPFRLVRCCSCGLLYLNPMMSQKLI